MKKTYKVLMCSALVALSTHAALTVEKNDDGFVVKRDGIVIIDSVAMKFRAGVTPASVKKSYEELIDGSKVWNEWNEDQEIKYRMEVAQRADGAIELTMSGEDNVLQTNMRILSISVKKELWEGKKYEALEGNGRAWKPVAGTFGGDYKNQAFRWMSVDGLTFDFNPLGAVDYCSGYTRGAVKGVWGVYNGEKENADHYEIYGGSAWDKMGSFTGAKLVIREGSFDDYDKYHAIRSYVYSQHLLPKAVYALGASKFGAAYVDGNAKFSESKGFGWTSGDVEVNESNAEGAYYSNVSGHGKAVYKVTGIPNGFHVFTVGAGNYTGIENGFNVNINGSELGTRIAVAPHTAWIASKTVHVEDGTVEFEFDGDFIVSTIGIQTLMADGEDFSMRRGFWLVNGYEPSAIYRNEDYLRPPVFPVSAEVVDLPEQGTELAAAPTDVPKPVFVPDASTPSLAWLKNVKIFRMLGNSCTLAELDDPAVRKQHFDEELNGRGYNVVMISGMHSRHTYFNHIGRGVEALGRVASDLHERGINLLDHHDATLLWHSDSGLRTLIERLPEMSRATNDNLPSFQFCPTNPVFKETYYAYLRNLVLAGVDGFQIDELQYWPHGCSCRYCREQFYKETGCRLPMNELDKNLGNIDSPLWKIWLDWRMNSVTNWFIGLREYVKDIKPDLVLSMYTTHWGFTRSTPRYSASSDMVNLGRVLNLYGTEVMTRNVMQSTRSLVPYRKMKNILNKEYKQTVWGWYYNSDWQTDYYAWAVSNMVGQASLLSTADIPHTDDMPPYTEFNGSENNMKREGAEEMANIALLFSAQSRDWNNKMGFEGELFGLAQTMEDLHIPYEMIGDMSLRKEILSKYKMLALCASGCLSDANVEVIKEFVRDGGIVHLSSLAGAFDGFGNLRKEWAFADIFGFNLIINSTREMVKSIDGVEVKKDLPSFASLKAVGNPLHVEKDYGAGKFIYSAVPLASQFYARECTPPHKWEYNPDLELYAAFCKEVVQVFGDASGFNVNAPAKVYTSLWKEADGTIAVHFLNGTGNNIKYGEAMINKSPVPAFPEMDKDIIFTLPAANVSSVTVASPDFDGVRTLDFAANDDGTITVTLPKDSFLRYSIVKIK